MLSLVMDGYCYQWLWMVAERYHWLWMVIKCYQWLWMVTDGY